MKPIILASQSLRRIELMKTLSYDFQVMSADIDETVDTTKDIQDEVIRLAYEKADFIFKQYPDSIVIGSDTLVVYQNQACGKPQDKEDAKRMLNMLSGKSHQVMSAVCIISSDECIKFCDISDITMYDLKEYEIDQYLNTDEWCDKAGSYAIQGHARLFIKEIRGDYYSIMGFPIARVYRELENITN